LDAEMPVTREEICWCYRNLLGREPESEAVLASHADCKNFQELTARFLGSPEYRERKRAKEPPAWTGQEPVEWFGPGGSAPGQPVAMKTVWIRELPSYCFIDKRSQAIHGRLSYPQGQEKKLSLLKIGYHGHKDPASLEGVDLELGSLCELGIHLAESHSKLKIGRGVGGKWLFRLFREPYVEIGDHATSNGADVFVDDGELRVGEDCMFANVFIHAGDNHAVFDLASGERLNVRRASVRFEPHVWAASRAAILGDAVIGAGSVIAADATVKGDVPRCVLVAGNPARPIKRGISWTRSATGEEWREVADRLAGAGWA
jgi:acetyltransferase-like isoleucine patch superfamily enzyme